MKTDLLQLNKPTKWGIALLTNTQKLISMFLALVTGLFFVALVIIYFAKFVSTDDIVIVFISIILLFLFGRLVMVFIKNIRKPTTITLIIEASVLIFIWVCRSFGNYLGELYINEKEPFVPLFEHAFRAATPETIGQSLLTGFNLGLPGIIVITLFYATQIAMRRYIALISNKQLGV